MKKIPVIIDCDTGIDDMISFVLAFSSEALDIKGITTVAGNQTLELTTYNTLNGLSLLGREDILLAKGEAKPSVRPLEDAGYIHGDSGLGTYRFEKPTDKKPLEQHAVDFMKDILMKSEDPVVILALAPLTNIDLLFKKYPECKDKIDKIVFMGGSIRTGNPTPVSTFNILVDPEAAKDVLKSGVPFHMCPLDTTKDGYITGEEIEQIGAIKNPVAQMTYDLCKFYENNVNNSNNAKKRFKGLCIHDLVTAAYVTNPELFTTKKYYGDVETKGELTTGFTMIDYEDILKKSVEEKNIEFIDTIDREGFMRVFFEALNYYTK
jgi:inosine-uridine nucleoside N-ribohydrolase